MKALFFDLDGTLLDTLPAIHAAVNGMLRHFGLGEIGEEETKRYIGRGANYLVRCVTHSDSEEYLRYFREHYDDSERLIRPFAGMEETIFRLKEKFLLGVLSNKPQIGVERAISRFFPAGTFAYLGGDSGLFPLKPDPSPARFAALTLRVPLRDCLMVGDGEADVMTAQNAGMVGVSVLWGYRTREQLEAVGATNFVHTPAELEKFSEKFA